MIQSFAGNKSLQLMQGDITQVPADAICNASNSQLAGGGGVDGAIHRAGGPAIMRELDELRRVRGGCPTGSAVATGAGSLPARWVFHAVGPVYRDGESGEPEALRSAYHACLALAEEKDAKHISFPSISTGVYGYPVREAAVIALDQVVQHLKEEAHKLQRVVFVLFDDRTFAAYSKVLRRMPS
jgi:O-acetyl-ADP-ribose deacetylase (regulator of RNase III)